jgi:hypothetical protein
MIDGEIMDTQINLEFCPADGLPGAPFWSADDVMVIRDGVPTLCEAAGYLGRPWLVVNRDPWGCAHHRLYLTEAEARAAAQIARDGRDLPPSTWAVLVLFAEGAAGELKRAGRAVPARKLVEQVIDGLPGTARTVAVQQVVAQLHLPEVVVEQGQHGGVIRLATAADRGQS